MDITTIIKEHEESLRKKDEDRQREAGLEAVRIRQNGEVLSKALMEIALPLLHDAMTQIKANGYRAEVEKGESMDGLMSMPVLRLKLKTGKQKHETSGPIHNIYSLQGNPETMLVSASIKTHGNLPVDLTPLNVSTLTRESVEAHITQFVRTVFSSS